MIAASNITNVLGDETDGWRAEGAERWQLCSEAGLDLEGSGSHPCYAEPNPALRANLYYWSHAGSLSVRVSTTELLPGGSEVVDPNPDAVDPVSCSPDPELEGSRFMITLLSRAEAACNEGTACESEAVIREQVSNFGGAAGGQAPAVPLTTKNMFPPSGAAEVVPNPNGGGVGVPISVWMNKNPACTPDGNTIDPSQGSWATCEAHEWYELESIPENVQCPGSCSCGLSESLSYTHGSEDILGIDLVADEEFPCDLFQFYFGTPRSNYLSVKAFAKVLSDCSTLDESSSGIFWISGDECIINANSVIGSAYAPVLLISAATTTRMSGGATIFGVLYVADIESSEASFESQGTNIVYGQVILDAEFGTYNGTFQVVYNENLITRISGSGGLGNVLGGWSDFHPADWQPGG